MLRLLAPDAVREADAALLPARRPVHLVAPGGHPFATIDVATADRKVMRITLRPCGPTATSPPPHRPVP
ncbi:hypothetical protein ACIO87_25110 [Streptomyces sp. NPDC087218]|uniref:hypothetical protein n=1 Tax=Streptomyces sp. NPDC087218 TaxID=3365769 RepID=UPI0037FF77C8